MLSYQFLQPCELNAHLTTLQNRYTVLKMQTRIMQTRIFSISESTLRGIRKRRIGQKKVKLAALIQTQNSGFLTFCLQPDDLSPMPRQTVFFLKKCDIRNRVAVQDVLTNAQKIGELTGAVDIYFLTSQIVFSATIN